MIRYRCTLFSEITHGKTSICSYVIIKMGYCFSMLKNRYLHATLPAHIVTAISCPGTKLPPLPLPRVFAFRINRHRTESKTVYQYLFVKLHLYHVCCVYPNLFVFKVMYCFFTCNFVLLHFSVFRFRLERKHIDGHLSDFTHTSI